MTGRLKAYDFQRVYEASTANLVSDFYIPAMMRATSYDRAVGYFRSSIFHLTQIAGFGLRSPRRTHAPNMFNDSRLDDEEIIRAGGNPSADVDRAITAEIEAALRDPKALPVVELLATMLSIGSLDVRVAYKADERGIFHSKVGIFRDDDGDAISFDGSANETFMAWTHNEERFKTSRSWIPGGHDQVMDDQQYFEDLWNGKRPSVVVKPLPEVAQSILRRHANPDPQSAVEKVRATSRRRPQLGKRPAKQLQDHQLAALASWRASKSGILDHVTGGGKTITALAAIREWFASVPRASTLVVVPSDLLTLQWRHQIDEELHDLDARILHTGGSRSRRNWQDHLRDHLKEAESTRPRIVIATMDTAASEKFLKRAPVGKTTLMIVDEVHKVGATARSEVLRLEVGGRLGLSATPKRFGDPAGTSAILDYFGAILQPSFGIADAQSAEPPRLVPYTYHIGSVMLDSDEAEEYGRQTKRVGMLAGRARSGGDPSAQEQLRLAIIARARVLKGARAKVDHAVSTLTDQYRQGQRWLVYCDDMKQLEATAEALHSAEIQTTRYVSSMAFSKPDTIERFEEVGGVLLSIRCLDEGIDIPSISHALILASSLNPREHLQRRGRVLRSSQGKVQAAIHDTIVGIENHDGNIRVFDHEISRAVSFAKDARNARHVLWQLDELMREPDEEWLDTEPEDSDD